MPWHISEGHGDCPDSRPFAVVKDDDGSVEGCHSTRDAAESQLAALYASEADQELSALATSIVESGTVTVSANSTNEVVMGKPNPGTDPDRRLKENKKGKRKPKGKPFKAEAAVEGMVDLEHMAGPFQGWHGVLAVEGVETGDGREFAPESLDWPIPPLPLMWQQESEPAHGHSVVVGRIDRIERRGADILGWGVLDLGSAEGAEITRQMGNNMAGGVSVDVDSVKENDVELVYPADGGEDEKVTTDETVVMLFGPPPDKVVFHRGRLRGATLVALPAFVEARLRLIDNDELTLALEGQELPQLVEQAPTLVAAGGPLYPPKTWFTNPRLQVPTPWSMDQQGRVFGHLGLWSTCHTTFPDRCILPPREGDFPYFAKRELQTEEGELVGVGNITMGTGHAENYLGDVPAAEHYDNTGTAVADIAVGEDKFGIWVAGGVRPGLSEIKIRELRAASLSGDWRRIGGKLRLVAVLAVNVPGFPIPRMRASLAAGELASVTAAGIPTDARRERYRFANAETLADGTIRIRRASAITRNT